jgi:hypothetical protein
VLHPALIQSRVGREWWAGCWVQYCGLIGSHIVVSTTHLSVWVTTWHRVVVYIYCLPKKQPECSKIAFWVEGFVCVCVCVCVFFKMKRNGLCWSEIRF